MLLEALYLAGLALIAVVGVVAARSQRGRPAVIARATRAWSAARDATVDRWGVPRTALAVAVAGVTATMAVLLLLGPPIVAADPIDQPIWDWVDAHQHQSWLDLMRVLTDLGKTLYDRVLSVAAGVLIGIVWLIRRRPGAWWVPMVLLPATVFVIWRVQLLVVEVFHRAPPPGSGGTYPSGGNARVVALFGLILILILAGSRPGRRVVVAGWTVVGMLAWTEAYSRVYLGAHWFTDVLAGLLFGAMMLATGAMLVDLFVRRSDVPPDPATRPPHIAEAPCREVTADGPRTSG